jgi:C4-dicarboxylate transporter, DctM subunit
MNPVVVGVIGIVLLLLFFVFRMPIAYAMAFVGFIGFAYLTNPTAALSLLAQDIYQQLSSYPLSVIPMFILMGTFAFASGISRRLYGTAYTWVGQYRGGLTMATVLACGGFSAICGSSTATAATMGKIALPEMKKYRYDDTLATGSIAASGTLGILIPPSNALIVYGILTEQSIGKLFIAGVLPGILLTFLFVLTVTFICLRNPALGPPGRPTTWSEKLRSTTGINDTIILFALAIGGLFLGWFSPTQAGAIGAGGTLIIGLVRRQLTWKKFIEAVRDGLLTACMVIFIITGGVIFGHFMAVSRIPFMLAEKLVALPIPPIAIMIVMLILYFVGGFFMDSLALIVVTIPIFFPVVQELGFDPIWFGIMLVVLGEMGVITPPVGVNVFVIKGISPDVPLETIFRGILPFLVALIICACLLIVFPKIATFLPSFTSY